MEEKLIILIAQSLKISLDQARVTSEEGGMYRYDAKQIMKIIRPYLRTSEPVSVDVFENAMLACDNDASEADKIKSGLEAVGVKYVD